MTVKEYFKEKDINPDDLLHMRKDQDGEWWQSIDVEHMLGEFAKMYTLQVVREAVEDELKFLKDFADTMKQEAVCSRIFSRIESKLTEES